MRNNAVALPLTAEPVEPRPTRTSPALFDSYAPGPIRAATDDAYGTVAAFVEAHPEYAKLSHDEVVQAMSTYRTDEEHATRERLYGEGIPRYWRRGGLDDLVDNVEGA